MKWFDRWFLQGMGHVESELGWRFGTIILIWELDGLANYPNAAIMIDTEIIKWDECYAFRNPPGLLFKGLRRGQAKSEIAEAAD